MLQSLQHLRGIIFKLCSHTSNQVKSKIKTFANLYVGSLICTLYLRKLWEDVNHQKIQGKDQSNRKYTGTTIGKRQRNSHVVVKECPKTKTVEQTQKATSLDLNRRRMSSGKDISKEEEGPDESIEVSDQTKRGINLLSESLDKELRTGM